MKILVIGSGGREHALCWRFAQEAHSVFALPGSAGIALVATCVDVPLADHDGIVAQAIALHIDLVVVGPELPLVSGLADKLRAAQIDVFGPGADGAKLEASKKFSKRFFEKYGIRTAKFFACRSVSQVEAALAELGPQVVVKADGLAAGKGVVVCSSTKQACEAAAGMFAGRFGAAGSEVIVEQRIVGREVSMMALCDGKRFELLAEAEDHKAIFDGDVGPNTGGMGTVSPVSWVNSELVEQVEVEIVAPTIAGLRAEGIDYRGVLYAGLMVDDEGVPWLLEYNVRFGDPETQPIVARLQGDLGAHLHGAARGELPKEKLGWDSQTAVCVVLASAGYPVSSSHGDLISGLAEAGRLGALVFHAGTARPGVGRTQHPNHTNDFITAGGRVLGVTSLGDDHHLARAHAYAAVATIDFSGMQYRSDIGERGKQ